MQRKLSTVFKISFYALAFALLVWACKKDKDITDPIKPGEETEEVIPGVTVGYGAELLDPAEYEKIPLIQEPQIASGANSRIDKTPVLPSDYDFSSKMPPPRSQGRQGSCVAWAVGYATLSYTNATAKGQFNYLDQGGTLNESFVSSPAYIFNQIKVQGCSEGSIVAHSLHLLKNQGACTWQDMPYNQDDCNKQPTADQKQKATAYKIKDWGRIEKKTDVFRKFLYYDHPIIISARLDNNFKNHKDSKDGSGEYTWNSFSDANISYHAMVIVGYDDNRKAFKIQNSWGAGWANKGFIWMSYDILPEAIREAYIMVAGEMPQNLATPQLSTMEATTGQDGNISLKGQIARLGEVAIIRYGIAASYTSQEPTDQIEEEENTPIKAENHLFSVTAPKTPGTLYYRAFAQTPFEVYYGETKSVEVKGTSTEASGDLLYGGEVLDAGNGKIALLPDGRSVSSKLSANIPTGKGPIFHRDFYIAFIPWGDEIYAYGRTDHSLKWKQKVSGLDEYVTYPHIQDETVYLTTTYGITALDIRTGARKWDYSAQLAGKPYVKGDTVYFGAMYQPLRSLDAKTGKLIREYRLPGQQGREIPVVYQEKLFYLASNGIYAYNILTGEMIWEKKGAMSIDNSKLLTIANGSLCMTDPTYSGSRKAFISLAISDGSEKWRYSESNNPISRYHADDRHVALTYYQGGANKYILVVLDIKTGKQKWTKEAPNPIDFVLAEDRLFASSRTAIAYDVNTGAVLWENHDSQVDNPVLVTTDGKIYAKP